MRKRRRAVQTPPRNRKERKEGSVDCNFKVDPAFHRAFKTAAAMKGLSMKELFEASFQCYLQSRGTYELGRLLANIR